MNKLEKMISGLILGKYPKTNQVLQGMLVSGMERLTAFPGTYNIPYGTIKAIANPTLNENGLSNLSTWKKMSLYALGAALPYADKIYCALAPMVENFIR